MKACAAPGDYERYYDEDGGVANVVVWYNDHMRETMIVGVIFWYILSSMKFQAEMGLLLALIMFINIFAALVLIPTLVNIFRPKFLGKVKFHQNSSHAVEQPAMA